MTLSMADSIYVANLPAGYDAYLGYADGEWPTAAAVEAKFPGKPVVSLTVLGGTTVADGCDIETGDLTPDSGAGWIAWRLSQGAWRPVGYAGVLNMTAVLAALDARAIQRSQVRLLSAHYDAGEHICGPDTCGLVSIPMDGTQWSDSARGTGTSLIDASVLADDFFEEAPVAVVIPGGVPGEWLSYQAYAEPDGSVVITGQGTTGLVYWTRKPPGGTWSDPVALPG